MRTRTQPEAKDKTCRLCKTLKPRSEFYRAGRMSDKLNARCKECIRSTSRTWAKSNGTRKHIPSAERRWHRMHPEVKRARAAAARARKAGVPGRFTGKQLLEKFAFYGWKCYLCKAALPTFTSATIDHRKPFDRGGSNWLANVAPACLRCNMRKNRLTEVEFRRGVRVKAPLPQGPTRECPTCGTLVWERFLNESP